MICIFWGRLIVSISGRCLDFGDATHYKPTTDHFVLEFNEERISMSIPALLLGSMLSALSIFVVLKANKKTAALKKYESENRSADGVVAFASIDVSRTHAADKGLYTVMGIVGFCVGLLGLALLVAGINVGLLGF